MERLTLPAARALFARLPPERQIITLSPDYVAADAARDDALEPFFIGCETADGVWLHGVHRSKVPGADLHDFQSPYGYGGPSTSIADETRLAALWADYAAFCRAHNVLAEFVRFHPLSPDRAAYGGQCFHDRECVAIPVQNANPRAGYETRARTAVLKAEKSGVTIREGSREEMSGRFADFYREGMRMIGASDFYLFPDAYFSALSAIDAMKLLIAEHEGQWVAAALFFTGTRVWEYHLSAAAPQGRRLSATNLVIDAAAQQAHAAGAQSLFLGGGTDKAADNPLLFFKSGFSGLKVPFYIGGVAHLTEEYERRRAEFPEGAAKSRILFYR